MAEDFREFLIEGSPIAGQRSFSKSAAGMRLVKGKGGAGRGRHIHSNELRSYGYYHSQRFGCFAEKAKRILFNIFIFSQTYQIRNRRNSLTYGSFSRAASRKKNVASTDFPFLGRCPRNKQKRAPGTVRILFLSEKTPAQPIPYCPNHHAGRNSCNRTNTKIRETYFERRA